jgi:hypothetical protein
LFLRRSTLPTDQLREVWRLASGGTSKAKLEKNDWLVACKLVAAIQSKGGEPNISVILNTYEAFPIAGKLLLGLYLSIFIFHVFKM